MWSRKSQISPITEFRMLTLLLGKSPLTALALMIYAPPSSGEGMHPAGSCLDPNEWPNVEIQLTLKGCYNISSINQLKKNVSLTLLMSNFIFQ